MCQYDLLREQYLNLDPFGLYELFHDRLITSMHATSYKSQGSSFSSALAQPHVSPMSSAREAFAPILVYVMDRQVTPRTDMHSCRTYPGGQGRKLRRYTLGLDICTSMMMHGGP